MLSNIVRFLFFANYFVGFLAVALSIETAYQLALPFLSAEYYLLLFSVTVLYYTFAYANPGTSASPNPRTAWYQQHRTFAARSQLMLLVVSIVLATKIFIQNFYKIISLPWPYWLLLGAMVLAAALYYGLLPKSLYRLNLRNTGWLKAFVIGFVWAGCVNILPITMARVEQGIHVAEPGFMLWLFLKNWMFCTVNAIMFDIKDYEDDSNRQLKTFVVRFGLYRTITFILIPLLLVGLLALLLFARYKHFAPETVLFNTIPFLSLLWVAFSLHTPKKILFYLIVIDGLLLVKAICGILGIIYAHQ
ncbi:UbiA prenyltransferase family protein [Dyadobacter jejuensis]|uniref:UbiA prenyltransferase family protein n=1 Tax=Dyadobacter jejuensis TaxID=1082580 RepID=A0A316AHU7_9BACT|nr:UbiA family prenyltransferase [Dyadobacter jejuensis]PWJ57262.1 UbiA prenyltransferase family protein [Dyadobacter jejuensis]